MTLADLDLAEDVVTSGKGRRQRWWDPTTEGWAD